MRNPLAPRAGRTTRRRTRRECGPRGPARAAGRGADPPPGRTSSPARRPFCHDVVNEVSLAWVLSPWTERGFRPVAAAARVRLFVHAWFRSVQIHAHRPVDRAQIAELTTRLG